MNLTRPNSSMADMEEARYRKRRSFRTGYTLTDEKEVLLWEELHGGTGKYYQWKGALNKVVLPNSTPLTSGGISESGWVDVGDANYLDDIDEELLDIRDDIQTLAGQVSQGGKSAYQSYVDTTTDNPPITEAEWVASLKGATGPGLTILGSFGAVSDLPLTENKSGDAYIVDEQMWVWDGSQWVPVGEVGPEGKSAYDVWKTLPGNQDGTVQEFLASIKGDTGDVGPEGQKGDPGQNAAPLIFMGNLENISDLPPSSNNNISQAYTINKHLYVSTGTSWVDIGDIQGPQGDIGPQGPQGVAGRDGIDGEVGKSLLIQDSLDDPAQLPPTGSVGDAYVIGRDLYVWLNNATTYKDIGPFVGPSGATGADGQGVNPKGELPNVANLPTSGNTTGDMYYIQGHSYIYNGTTFVDFGDLTGPSGRDGNTITGIVSQTSNIPDGKHVDLTFTSSDGRTINAGFDLTDIHGNPVNALGQLPSVNDLPSTNNTTGDMYYVTGVAYIWNGSAWINMGSVIGPAGNDGPQGVEGKQGPQGIQGPEGPQGIQGNDGPPGPGATILGSFSDPSELPATANVGDCYLIDGDFWVYDGTKWVNTGPFVGPTGPQGPEGPQGPQGNDGQQGLKGEQGTIWIALARDPNPSTDGRVNDYFINTQTLQFFKKTSASNWASLGYMGGGNVYDAPSDGTQYVRQDGAWVAPDVQEAALDGNMYARKDGAWEAFTAGVPEAPATGKTFGRKDSAWAEVVPEAPVDAYTHVRSNGAWKRFDRYDLNFITTSDILDVSSSSDFIVNLTTSGSKNLTLTNLPQGRSMVIVITFLGNTGTMTWTNNIKWTNDTAPVLSVNQTTVVIHWINGVLNGFTPGGY